MEAKRCIAMILAGGRGERLGSLTTYVAKPAVTFGGKYKIIDFTLNNCKMSGIDTVGVLTQYLPAELHRHIKKSKGSGDKCRIFPLPPKTDAGYSGTADAVYRNIQFIEQAEPEDVLILSGDHVYEMDYSEMLKFHRESGADATIASTPVEYHEASRFGILSAESNGRITQFEEKPKNPKSIKGAEFLLASMGVYIFKWNCLKDCITEDSRDETSSHDFGKNIIPKMLRGKEKLYAYIFGKYWRDIGTVHSLWDANMDVLQSPDNIKLNFVNEADIIELHRSAKLNVRQSIISDFKKINGLISHSVISENVSIGEGTVITGCVIMPNASIGRNVRLSNVIVGSAAWIMDSAEIGGDSGSGAFAENNICSMGVSLVAPLVRIEEGLRFRSNSHIDKSPIQNIKAYITHNQARRKSYTSHTMF